MSELNKKPSSYCCEAKVMAVREMYSPVIAYFYCTQCLRKITGNNEPIEPPEYHISEMVIGAKSNTISIEELNSLIANKNLFLDILIGRNNTVKIKESTLSIINEHGSITAFIICLMDEWSVEALYVDIFKPNGKTFLVEEKLIVDRTKAKPKAFVAMDNHSNKSERIGKTGMFPSDKPQRILTKAEKRIAKRLKGQASDLMRLEFKIDQINDEMLDHFRSAPKRKWTSAEALRATVNITCWLTTIAIVAAALKYILA